MDSNASSSTRDLPRGQRYFCINGSWYFNTRDGQRGPFASKQAMQEELDRYLQNPRDSRTTTG